MIELRTVEGSESLLTVEGFQHRWDELASELKRQRDYDPRTAREVLDDLLADLDAAPTWTPPEEPLPTGAVLLPERGDNARVPMTAMALVHEASLYARLAIVLAALAFFASPWLTVLIFRTVHW